MRNGQRAESNLIVVYLAFFFFFLFGKNLLCMCAEVEGGSSFNTDNKSNRGNNRCG